MEIKARFADATADAEEHMQASIVAINETMVRYFSDIVIINLNLLGMLIISDWKVSDNFRIKKAVISLKNRV